MQVIAPHADHRPSEDTMVKKVLAALGLTGALLFFSKKRRQGDEFQFSDNGDK